MSGKFAVCLSCIDGRIQLPLINWIKANYRIDFVDLITEPGMDGLLANQKEYPTDVWRKLDLSLSRHNADPVIIAGHYDCAANPIDKPAHHRHIAAAVEKIGELLPDRTVVGLWVSSAWDVERIAHP